MGKSSTNSETNGRWEKYNKSIGHLRGTSRPEILPFRNDAEEISGVSQGQIVYKREGFNPRTSPRFRESKESPTLTQNMGTGGNNVPMVMNLQKRDINRPAIRKRIESGLKPNAGSGTIGKEDEAYCLDAGNNQGVARCLDSNMHKGVTPEYYYEKKKRNVVACLTPDRIHKRQHGRRFKNEEEPMFTLTGQDIHGVKEYDKLRRLTPVECERLQGFPDGWTDICSDTQRYRQMGNAVSVPVIKAIGRKLINEI